jgi:Caspase domain
VLKALDPAKRLRLIILDACRENPFSKSMKRTIASRSIGRGLARIEPTSSNTLVAFAAKAGAVADDGGENSQFVQALVKYIAEPGLDLRLALGRVRDEVLQKTGNRQEPFVYGSLGGDTVALVPQASKAAETETDASIDYELAAQIGTKEVWDSFITHHPAGFYANLARAQINKLSAAEQSHADAEDVRHDAEGKAAQKAEELRKQLEEAKTGQTAAVKQKPLEQMKKELEEAKKKAELAQQQADAARQQVEQAKRQAALDAQLQVEEARRTANEVARQDTEKVAALTPGTSSPQVPPPPPIDQADITRLLQAHLKRVGCNSGNVDGKWEDSSRKALELFNRNAHTEFDVKVASLDALDAVRRKSDRVCPLVCAKGERAEGDRCVEIGCAHGYFLNSSGSCEKRREPAPRARTARKGPGLQLRPDPSGSSGGACGLDASGHREGGFLCRN